MLRINSTPFLFRNSMPKYLSESDSIMHPYGIAILTISSDENIILSEANQEFLQLTSHDKDRLIGINLCENPTWNDEGQLWEAICGCLEDHKTTVIQWHFKCQDGPQSINCSIIPVSGQEKNLTTLTLILSDNSADIAFAEQIKKFNYYDKLTGLANKNYFNEAIETIFSENHPNGEIAVLLINILKFQRINESYGYDLGDTIIQKFASNLTTRIPSNALLARFDGDKFAILLVDDEMGKIQNEAQALADSLHHDMTIPVLAGEQEVHLSLTIGIAINSVSSLIDTSKLIQQAHIAMMRLNTTSQDRTLLYQPELQIRANSRLKMENDLREALLKKDMSLEYQPIISLNNGGLIGFEALCRWNHPTMGMISPIEFIPLAEESGLIIPLGKWVLREACISLQRWIDKYPNFSNLVMNVNVSGLQLLQDGFVSTTHEALLNAGLSGHQLCLEITETTLVENSEIVRDILLDLRALDIGLAIDDFGTGYSSLSYLNQFPVDTLKIDKSFVNRISATEDSYKIIHIISTLAQTLGMNVVAEGIEQEEQVKALKRLGCQTGQGFLFSRPLSFENAEKYIRTEATSLV